MKFIAGFVAALVIMVGAALATMYAGAYNVAADVPDNPIVDWYLSNTMFHSVFSRANAVKAPSQFTDQQARAGFAIYNKTCVLCHGAPGKGPADIAKGLNPQAPDLTDYGGLTSADLFWIIKNGIKMSAMASYGKVHNDDEIWNLVAFVQRIPTIRPDEYEQLEKEAQ